MPKSAVSIDGLWKYFRLYHEKNQYLKATLLKGRRSRFDEFWALKDVSFEIPQGSTFGIIGSNGSGKSTLLKCLAGILTPDKGSVQVNGRISALLELGAGFHPDLTGRENVFLNGAILGMTQREIQSKFDEIVDFAGVERYIDTPVKRYSSGMYIRLAFAVSAHLEPDILIIDEVLAVGDVEFQKKCWGKMKDVSQNDGRTILFVSHNMTAIKNICKSTLVLQNGKLLMGGNTESIIKQYLGYETVGNVKISFEVATVAAGNENIRLKRLEVVPELSQHSEIITVHTPINIEIEFWNEVENKEINLSLHLETMNHECVFNVGTKPQYLQKGLHKANCHIPGDFLNDGYYTIRMMFVAERSVSLFEISNIINFEVHEDREETAWHGKWPGFVRPNFKFLID
jgi:lipopolysaccharide transport system ATP-binding protein